MAGSEDDVAAGISEIIAGYRHGEIPARRTQDVIRFVDRVQHVCDDWMDEQNRRLFMEGLRDALRNHYWDRSNIVRELTMVASGAEQSSRGRRCAILSLQELESSQARLVGLIRDSAIPVVKKLARGFEDVLYIDDAVFTGRTLKKYLQEIYWQARELESGDRPSCLHVWHIRSYIKIEEELSLEIRLLGELGIRVSNRQVEQLQRRSREVAVKNSALIPRQIWSNSPRVRGYLDSSPTLRKIGDSGLLWRDETDASSDGVFADGRRRDVVERAFLEVGCWLRAKTKNWNHLMRPFGYVATFDTESLGFGSMFCTCFNSANTSPVALWWGDPNANSALSAWDPLLPRRT